MTVRTAQIQNVVITRSKKGNVELAAELRRRGFNPISIDTISLLPPKDWSPIDIGLKDLHFYQWLVFTSVTGVEIFANRMKKLSLKIPWEDKPRVAAIGKITARALSKLGITTSFTPSSYLTERLADELPYGTGKRVLLLRADIANPAMSERLRRRGFDVTEFRIYRTEYTADQVGRQLDDADLIVFASPSAVNGFCNKVATSKLGKLRGVPVACIGPVTATAAREHGFNHIFLPKSHTFDSLLEKIVRVSHDA